MTHVLHLHLKPTATTEELVEIADVLERWSDDCLDLYSCEGKVEGNALDDLKNGERPKSEFLRICQDLEVMNKMANLLNVPPIDPGPHRLEQLEAELEPLASKGAVVIFVRGSIEVGASLEAIETLRARLHEIEGVDRIEEKDVREDDDEDFDS